MDTVPVSTANVIPAANSGDKGGAPAAAAGVALNDNQFSALLAGSLPADPAAAATANVKALATQAAKEDGEQPVGAEPARGSKDDTIANLMDALAGLQPSSAAVPMPPILPVERAPSLLQDARNAVVVAHVAPDPHETLAAAEQLTRAAVAVAHAADSHEIPAAAERRTRAVGLPIANDEHTPHLPAVSARSETASVLGAAEPAKESRASHAADPADAPEASFAQALHSDAPEASFAHALHSAASEASFTHALHSAAPATAAAAPVVREIPSPVGAPAWNTQLSQQVVWIANERHQVAEIRLNPPDLGPIGITLKLDGDGTNQATVQFTSPHAPVRDAIESALPHLREMMADAGITLGQATVGADSFHHSGGHENTGQGPSTAATRDAGIHGGVAAVAATPRRGIVGGTGLVDTFA